MRSLRSRECGLYEAADILLGDHLYEKSDAVQWISVERPDKRKLVYRSELPCSMQTRGGYLIKFRIT